MNIIEIINRELGANESSSWIFSWSIPEDFMRHGTSVWRTVNYPYSTKASTADAIKPMQMMSQSEEV